MSLMVAVGCAILILQPAIWEFSDFGPVLALVALPLGIAAFLEAGRTFLRAGVAEWRGIWFVFGIVVVPLVVANCIALASGAVGMRGLPEVGLVAAFAWGSITFPFFAVVPAVAGPPGQLFALILQWGVIGAVVGHRMNRASARATLLVALCAVVGTGVTVLLLLRAFGYRVVFEGP